MGFGIKKDVTSNVTPSTIVFFDKVTPTTAGVVFDPNTPATTDILYISSVNASTWIWDGSAYISYAAPSVSSTEWYLYGTTIDAGSNKTADIQRYGAIYVSVDSYFNDVRVGHGSGDNSSNTIVGIKCLDDNITGTNITAVGSGALQSNTASDNTAFGWASLNSNTTGFSNVAIGTSALQSNTGSSQMVAVGYNALYSNVGGDGNTAIGNRTLENNISGYANTAVGYDSLRSNNAVSNTAVGYEALRSNTSGENNTAIGSEALQINITGSNNSGVGYRAGRFLANGSTSNSTSQNSVFLGSETRSLTNNDTNQIVIGYLALGKGSNTVQLGNTSIANTYLQGAVTFNNAYTLPTTDGTANYFLKTNGSGVVTWASGGGSGVCGIKNSSGVYTYYATLNLAITAAVSGQTVDILTDITETGSVTVTTKTGVKINGNGYTYTLSVNDATNAITQAIESTLEIFNLKVVRTGRLGGSTGRVLVSNFYSNSTLKCQNVVFESTYGEGVSYLGFIYGLNIITYGSCVVGDAGAYNCNFTSSNGLGIDNSSSAKEVINCNVASSGTAINMTYGSVYDSVGRSSSGIGIFAFRIVNSMGVSVSNTGIGTTTTLTGHTGYNCVGISTSGVGLNGTFTNSTGISTSGYAASGGSKTNCTLISSSNYGSFQENLNNSFLQSTTNVPLWLSTGKLVNTCTAICLWDNVGGHAINTTAASTGVDIRNCNLTVTNASAYCINGASASTFKYASNTFKGSTTAVNTTNVTQGITNTEDNQGNILI